MKRKLEASSRREAKKLSLERFYNFADISETLNFGIGCLNVRFLGCDYNRRRFFVCRF